MKIKMYPSELYLTETESGINQTIDFEGCAGEFTREDWKFSLDVDHQLTTEEIDDVLFALSKTSNIPFFAEH